MQAPCRSAENTWTVLPEASLVVSASQMAKTFSATELPIFHFSLFIFDGEFPVENRETFCLCIGLFFHLCAGQHDSPKGKCYLCLVQRALCGWPPPFLSLSVPTRSSYICIRDVCSCKMSLVRSNEALNFFILLNCFCLFRYSYGTENPFARS